jgi:hypothetical protein
LDLIAAGLLGASLQLALASAAMAQRVPTRDDAHIVQKFPRSWKEIQVQNVVMQQRDYSCGAAALATLTRYYWGDNTSEKLFLDEVDKVLPSKAEIKDRVENGLTMTDLKKAAEGAGYDVLLGTARFEQLIESKVPVIVGLTMHMGVKQTEFRHFVVYRGFDGWWVYLADPIRGNVRVSAPEFVQQWQRNAVLIVAKPDTDPKKNSPLTVHRGEMYLGTLNYLEARKALTRQAATPPMPGFR